MKQLINYLFGTKRPRYTETSFHLKQINSILLKPIGYALGDAILHITHLKQLKTNYPHIKLGIIVTERCYSVYAAEDFIDFLMLDSAKNYFQQRKKWDLYLDFQPTYTSRAIFLDSILSPKFVINFGKNKKKYYNLDKTKNYDFTTPNLKNVHISQYLYHSILGKYLSPAPIHYSLTPQQLSNTLQQCWQTGKIRVLLAPQGSGRQLPPQELRALIQAVIEKEQVSFVLSATPTYQDYAQQLGLTDIIALSPKTTILEYFALAHSTDIIISVDSASVHIACAYSKPLLAFYANCPHNIQRWQPINYADTFIAISRQIPNMDNNATANFEISACAEWLNMQIAKQLTAEPCDN